MGNKKKSHELVKVRVKQAAKEKSLFASNFQMPSQPSDGLRSYSSFASETTISAYQ